ncbi:GNAT family N-acetyltransferase [Campylobacter jejuni]
MYSHRLSSHNDIDFIHKCIEDGVNNGYFISINKQDIEKVIHSTNKTSHLYTITYDNLDAGMFLINQISQPNFYGLEINMLYVLPQYRGNGIGSYAIKYCEDCANGLPVIVRCDKQHSNRTITLFKKLGYRAIGIDHQPKHNKQNVVLLKL